MLTSKEKSLRSNKGFGAQEKWPGVLGALSDTTAPVSAADLVRPLRASSTSFRPFGFGCRLTDVGTLSRIGRL